MTKQIRLKDRVMLIKTCDDCPMPDPEYGMCDLDEPLDGVCAGLHEKCPLEDAGTPVITPEEITMFVMEQTSYAAKRRRSNWTGNYADVIPRLLEREILDYNTRLMDRFVVKKEDAE